MKTCKISVVLRRSVSSCLWVTSLSRVGRSSQKD